MENVPKMIEDVLDVLAKKFGTTGEFLWKAILKQQFIDGMMELFGSLISFFVLMFALKKAIDYIPNDMDPFSSFGWWALCLIAIISAFFFIYEAVTSLANPEYSAISDILNKFQQD